MLEIGADSEALPEQLTPMPPVLIMKGRTLAPVTQVMPAMVLAAQVRLHHLHQFLTTATEINVSS